MSIYKFFIIPGLFTVCGLLSAQNVVPKAPIPSQILSAKKVFISSGSDDCVMQNQFASGCTPGAYYNEFYSTMKSWGRFELTSSPADADLIFELNHSLVWTGSTDERYRLTMIDAHTHFILWSFLVFPEGASRPATQLKNQALARAQIVTNLRILVLQPDSNK